MIDFCKDKSEIISSSYHSMDPSSGRVPLWICTTESQSGNLSLKVGGNPSPSPCGNKMGAGILFQEHDTSSSQSTGQSYHEAPTIGQECNATHARNGASEIMSILSVGNQECVVPSLVNLGQSYACVPMPYTDPYYGGLLAQTMIQHPNMVNIGPARVPLPLELPQNEPIYVNAKQYHAILRRRQYRAKLEAQNKLSKGRKPYLHESRHLHALKRPRGSGGRFINTKTIQDSNPIVRNKTNNFTTEIPNSGIYYSKVFGNGFSATSGSDITSVSSSENAYPHQEIRFSLYPSSMGSYLAVNQ